MAETLLNIDQVSTELQLSKEQVMALVKQGALRGFLDQGVYKFRRADVDKYKEQAESSATVVMGEEGQGEPGSKVDLADIDAEPGADESDQTSVLAPVDDKKDAEKGEGAAVFEFSEDELGLSLDEGEGESDASKTSTDSVLVADESDSSMDILEVAEESSSDSATSSADLDFMDESSSADDVMAALEVEEETPMRPEDLAEEATPTRGKAPAEEETPVRSKDAAKAGSEQVTDILGTGEEDISDEELETLGLDEVTEQPQETILEEASQAEDYGVDEEEQGTGTAATMPVSDETETVGISQEDATQVVSEDLEPELEVPPLEAEGEFQGARVATGWEMVTPSALGNTMLVLALIFAALGGMFVLHMATGTGGGNPLATAIADMVMNLLS